MYNIYLSVNYALLWQGPEHNPIGPR